MTCQHLKDKVMKKSIVYLGILAAMFVNSSFAKVVEFDQQIVETEVSRTDLKTDFNLSVENNLSKPKVNLESEERLVVSTEVISTHYKKSIEIIIEEDKKITENQAQLDQCFLIEPTIENHIQLDNQIIESIPSNEVYPIDFDLINSTNKMSTNFELQSKEALKS